MKVFRRFIKGILLKGEASNPSDNLEGSLWVNSSENKLKAYLNAAIRSIVSEDQAQTLTNKTIDADSNTVSNLETDNLKAGVLVTDISLAASDTELPSALAVKSALALQNEADEITYDNTTSGLTATNVQTAIDEVDGNVDTVTSGLSNHLSDTSDAHDASAISYDNTTSGLIATEVQTAIDELENEIDGKQDAGNYITALTGDVTATGPGSVAATLATVNANVGSFTNADITVDAKGRITAAANGAPSGANTTLSNLTSPTAINQDLIFNKSNPVMRTPDGTSVPILEVQGGAITSGAGNGGTVVLRGGNAFSGFSGSITLIGGESLSTGTSGAISIVGGDAGSTASTGAVELKSGNKYAGASGSTGELIIKSGQVSSGNSSSGTVSISSGNTPGTGATGALSIFSGNAAGVANSGNIIIETGTVTSGTRGSIRLRNGSQGTIGHVWTSTDVNGSGSWQAAAAAGANTTLSNLTSPTAINQNLLPSGTIQIGSLSTPFEVIRGQSIEAVGATAAISIVNGAGTPILQMQDSSSLPSGNSAVIIRTQGASSSQILGLATENNATANATATKAVRIETGNKTAGTGNSGDIVLQTGTSSGGVRGDVDISARELTVTGVSQAVGLPIWKNYTISHTELQAAATTNDIQLLSLPAKGVIHAVIIKHNTAFSGGAISAYTVSVGISGNLTKYASAFNVFQATGDTVAQSTNVLDVENFGSATSIRISATSVGANLNASTAGSVTISVLWGILP